MRLLKIKSKMGFCMWDTERGKKHNQRLQLGVLLFATPIQYQLI